jgi:hypothetical protein
MLVACRLAGLSALEANYAAVSERTQLLRLAGIEPNSTRRFASRSSAENGFAGDPPRHQPAAFEAFDKTLTVG